MYSDNKEGFFLGGWGGKFFYPFHIMYAAASRIFLLFAKKEEKAGFWTLEIFGNPHQKALCPLCFCSVAVSKCDWIDPLSLTIQPHAGSKQLVRRQRVCTGCGHMVPVRCGLYFGTFILNTNPQGCVLKLKNTWTSCWCSDWHSHFYYCYNFKHFF